MEIKVLGTGCCSRCDTTLSLIDQVAKAKGLTVRLEKIVDLREIMNFGVMSTPGVVIDGKVVHTGSVPTRERVEQWLAA